MRDCPNAEMRDALPDLMHGTLPAHRQAAVRAHVEGCDACRAELALLARVRDAVSAPAIATQRIVSVLPRYRRQSAWRRLAANPALRIAAAVVLVAGGASLVLRDGGSAPASGSADSVTRRPPAPSAPAVLALGETFADVSDSALVALVEALDDLDASLSDEPESMTVRLGPLEGL